MTPTKGKGCGAHGRQTSRQNFTPEGCAARRFAGGNAQRRVHLLWRSKPQELDPRRSASPLTAKFQTRRASPPSFRNTCSYINHTSGRPTTATLFLKIIHTQNPFDEPTKGETKTTMPTPRLRMVRLLKHEPSVVQAARNSTRAERFTTPQEYSPAVEWFGTLPSVREPLSPPRYSARIARRCALPIRLRAPEAARLRFDPVLPRPCGR